MSEALKVKSGLPWRPQDVRDARAVGYLLRRAATREWNQLKREKCAAITPAERSWSSEECFDIRQKYRIYSEGFCYCFGQYYLTMSPFLPFGIICHCILKVCDLLFDFHFMGGL